MTAFLAGSVPVRLLMVLMGALALTSGIFATGSHAPASAPVAAGPAVVAAGETEGVVEFRLLKAPAGDERSVASADAGLPGFVTSGRWGDTALPVPVRYNFTADPKGVTAFGATLWAMRQWESIGGQKLRFRYAGATAAIPEGACTDRSRDGVNSVNFAKLDSKTLGTTCVFFALAPGSQVRRVIEFDLELTSEVKWSLGATTPAGAFDLPSTVLHELGHAAGLDHTPVLGAVMVEALAPGDQFRMPADDDREGVLSLYADPAGGPATPAVTPMALPPVGYSTQRVPAISHD